MKHDFTNDISCYLARLQATIGKLDKNEINTFINLLIDVFVEQLKNFYQNGDVVIGISGSGNSKNVLKAIEYANANGGLTIGLTGFDGGKLRQMAKYSVNMNIDDMQISEDLHMMLDHLSMKVITNNMISETLAEAE